MDSVSRQTWPDWEHIIIDDGSTDGTVEEVRRRSAADSRIRLLIREGAVTGANVCRNIGIKESRGRYLVFLDSDDLLEPDCLGRRAEVMERNIDLDFATFLWRAFKHVPGDIKRAVDDDLCGDDLLRFLFLEFPWATAAPVWRKTSLVHLGGFDETLPSWQDVELHIRAICAGAKYLKFPQIDHHFRWQTDSTKVSTEQWCSPTHLRAALETFVKFERMVKSRPGMNWSRQRALCNLYFSVSESWIQQGKLSEALGCWHKVRERGLGPPRLHLAGAALLMLLRVFPQRLGLVGRLTHKWKGWMRMRTNPELSK